MKLIFSRKGFDSSAGGIPSPIMPDGRMLPLPIPQVDGPRRFSELRYEGRTLSSLIKQLGGPDWRGRCHLDPDLDPALVARPEGWQPAFGQSGSAQRHLAQEGVGEGDLFLFFGWFRQTEWQAGKLRFVKGAPDLHLLHSWLQVGEVCPVTPELRARFPGLAAHPHLAKAYPFNTLYLPAAELRLPGLERPAPGCGMFRHWRASRQLTRRGELRSVWQLPDCFWPEHCHQVLSYHRKPRRWQRSDEGVRLEAAYRGQEFVVETRQLAAQAAWLATLGLGSD